MQTASARTVLDRLTSPLPTEAYRTALNPLWAATPRGRITAIRPLTATSVAITMRTNRAWPGHRPGQFVTVGVDVDGVRHHRCYSLTSVAAGAGATTIEIAVHHVPGGVVSGHLNQRAKVGDLIHLDAPAGEFVLPTNEPRRLLFLSGGSGVTPVVAMLRELDRRRSTADVVVIHYSPSADATMFGTELNGLCEAAGRQLHLVHPEQGDPLFSHAELIRLCPDWAARTAYSCGPAPLMNAATGLWDDAGVLDALHLESFTPPAVVRPADAAPSDTVVTFDRSGVTTTVGDATTLLEVAEAAGVRAPSGCRSGVCHTCTTKLSSGCVINARTGRSADAGSHVQTCVSLPVGDVSLDL